MGIYRVMLTESKEWESPNYTILIQKTVLDILFNTYTVFLRTDKVEEFEYWKLFFKDVLKSKMTDEDVFANLVMKLIGKFNYSDMNRRELRIVKKKFGKHWKRDMVLIRQKIRAVDKHKKNTPKDYIPEWDRVPYWR